jgi:hypothetical protein
MLRAMMHVNRAGLPPTRVKGDRLAAIRGSMKRQVGVCRADEVKGQRLCRQREKVCSTAVEPRDRRFVMQPGRRLPGLLEGRSHASWSLDSVVRANTGVMLSLRWSLLQSSRVFDFGPRQKASGDLIRRLEEALVTQVNQHQQDADPTRVK